MNVPDSARFPLRSRSATSRSPLRDPFPITFSAMRALIARLLLTRFSARSADCQLTALFSAPLMLRAQCSVMWCSMSRKWKYSRLAYDFSGLL